MGGTIFISYRRGQDAGFAGRLFDRLERTFRRKALFMDVDSITPGQAFVSILEARVAEYDVLLALIGRGWLTATDEAGGRRLDNPDDFVRIEIATALTQANRVIPVLIDDVPMPRAEELPEVLRPLVRRHATRLSHDRFKTDSDRLIRALKHVLADAETVRRETEARREAVPPAPSPTPDGTSESRKGSLALTPRSRKRVKVARRNDESSSSSLGDQWERVSGMMRSEIGEAAYRSWLKPMVVRGENEGIVTIAVPTRFMREWVMAHYADRLRALWAQENSAVRRINIVADPNSS